MRLSLTRHPGSECAALAGIDVEVERPGPRALTLRYRLSGGREGLRLPPPAPSERTDELWRHTCLEAFIRVPGSEAYYELNFAPSSQWAAYRFTGRREGMTPVWAIEPLGVTLTEDREGLVLHVSLDLEPLRDLPPDASWPLGLSAVIEDAGGHVSHWALAHPTGRADFHHADCFAAEVRAPERA
jgi:hypothetical protein